MPGHNIEATHSGWLALLTRVQGRVGSAIHEDGERGAGLLEYALLLVLVLIVAFLSILLFGETIVGLFEFAAGTFNPTPGSP